MNCTHLASILLVAVGIWGPAFAQEAAPPASSPAQPAMVAAPWELKGLHLGMTQAEALAAAPSLECETESFDAGLGYCIDRHNTLAGENAFLVVKLLDGEVVYVALQNINFKQMTAAIPTLIERFGQPSNVHSFNQFIHEDYRDKTVTRDRYKWQGAGNAVAIADPFEWTNDKIQKTYSAITLSDASKYDNGWLIRYNQQGKPKADL